VCYVELLPWATAIGRSTLVDMATLCTSVLPPFRRRSRGLRGRRVVLLPAQVLAGAETCRRPCSVSKLLDSTSRLSGLALQRLLQLVIRWRRAAQRGTLHQRGAGIRSGERRALVGCIRQPQQEGLAEWRATPGFSPRLGSTSQCGCACWCLYIVCRCNRGGARHPCALPWAPGPDLTSRRLLFCSAGMAGSSAFPVSASFRESQKARTTEPYITGIEGVNPMQSVELPSKRATPTGGHAAGAIMPV
jgi:hypothetical protein